MLKIPPFYSNTEDNTHCYQATLRMILASDTGKEYSWDELDVLTGKDPGMWTWPMMGLMNMKKMGYDVVSIGDFDMMAFTKDGKDYLVKKYGQAIADEQEKNSDLKKAQKEAEIFHSSGINVVRRACVDDVKKYIDDGYYVIPNINHKTLNNQEEYSGHFIFIYKYSNDYLTAHDPGLPPYPEREISWSVFTKAWAYPDESACRFHAFKYKKV